MIRVVIEHRWEGEGETLAEAIRNADPCGDLTPGGIEVYQVQYRAWNGSDGKETFDDFGQAEAWLESQGLQYAGDSLSGDAQYYTPDGEIEDDDDGAWLPCLCEEEEPMEWVTDDELWQVLEDLGLTEDEDEDD